MKLIIDEEKKMQRGFKDYSGWLKSLEDGGSGSFDANESFLTGWDDLVCWQDKSIAPSVSQLDCVNVGHFQGPECPVPRRTGRIVCG